MRATVQKIIKLDPIIATAIDTIREAKGLSFPAYLAKDPRVVRWFREQGVEMPEPPKAGRPVKPRATEPNSN